MGSTSHRLDAWLVVLGSSSLVAWSVLAFDESYLMLPAFCSVRTLWSVPPSVSASLVLVFNSPAKLASSWVLMIAAMMAPLVVAPLRHVRDRSFTKRRVRAVLLFFAGYIAAWMAAGVGLQSMALAVRLAAPAPLGCLVLGAATAMWWQVSPAKQWCLNRCHRRPHLAAFGASADRDAFEFGLTNGASCVGACWALMLLTLIVGHGHVLAMITVTLFAFAERLESPATLVWRWRGPGKALRIAVAQARMRLTLRSDIKEASQ